MDNAFAGRAWLVVTAALTDKELPLEQFSVLQVLAARSRLGDGDARWIRQPEIARSAEWLDVSNPTEGEQSACRRIRSAIRELRVRRGIPIISSSSGYAIASSEKEAVEFLSEMGHTARARAKASMQTYRAMCHALNITPELPMDAEES
jgi:hypothetical protein